LGEDVDFIKILFGKYIRKKNCKCHFGEDDIIIDNFHLNSVNEIPEEITKELELDFYMNTGKDIYLLRLQNNPENKILFVNNYNSEITLLTYIVIRKSIFENIDKELKIIVRKLKEIKFPKYYNHKIYEIEDWNK
jgi:hypothetical protein